MNALVQMDSALAEIKRLQAENEALKASIPQVKHDAIIEAVGATQDWHFDRGEPLEYCSPSKLAEYAANLLTKQEQAQ